MLTSPATLAPTSHSNHRPCGDNVSTDGNITSDGTNSYAWDAENRLIQINYPGSGNNSQFIYDASDQCVQIVEKSGGTVNSTKQFVWAGEERREERDGSGNPVSQFFDYGFNNSVTNYFYSEDLLGSVHEVTDQTGLIRSQYQYTPFGLSDKIRGDIDSEFQYAHYYLHKPSGFNCAYRRFYAPSIGRWISRDPEVFTGENSYAYVNNSTINSVDPDGTNGLVLGGGATVVLIATGILFVIALNGSVQQIIALNKQEVPLLPTPEELTGKTVEEVKEILENLGLIPKPAKTGEGTMYPVPGKQGDQYRIKQPETDPRTPPEKRGWNCIITKSGKSTRIPLKGPGSAAQ